MNFEYSATAVEANRQFDYWTDAVCSHCLLASSFAMNEEPFRGHFWKRSVGRVEISSFSAPMHRWSRKGEHVRKDPNDDLWLCYVQDGSALFSQSGREVRLATGDMTLYDASKPFEGVQDTRATVLIRLPRRSLLRTAPDAERLTAQVINDQQPGGAPLRALLDQAVSIDFGTERPAMAEKFSEAVLNLITFALEFQSGDLESACEHNLYSKVVAYIHRNFQNSDLNLDSLATAHHASSRTISRAFARRQQTPMGFVWQVRLDNSRRALAEGRARSVTDAAFDNGFSDVSHFSRAFRKAFGVTPHTVIPSRGRDRVPFTRVGDLSGFCERVDAYSTAV